MYYCLCYLLNRLIDYLMYQLICSVMIDWLFEWFIDSLIEWLTTAYLVSIIRTVYCSITSLSYVYTLGITLELVRFTTGIYNQKRTLSNRAWFIYFLFIFLLYIYFIFKSTKTLPFYCIESNSLQVCQNIPNTWYLILCMYFTYTTNNYLHPLVYSTIYQFLVF